MLLALTSNAQKEDYVWVMGNLNNPIDSSYAASTIDFNYDPPKIELRHTFYPQSWVSTSICNEDGELLLYSNGIDIYNEKDEIIQNGSAFQSVLNFPNGFPMSQGTLIVPVSDDKSKLLYISGDIITYMYNGNPRYGCSPITFSTIEIDGSVANVSAKKVPITYDTLLSGPIVGVKHGNGRDWWIIGAPMLGSNKFHKLLVTNEGVIWNHSQEVGFGLEQGAGQASISPDGEWLAYFQNWGIHGIETYLQLDVFKFDRCTGMLIHHFHMIDTAGTFATFGGLAFSPSSRFIYTSQTDKIYQWDLESDDIFGSKTLVAEYDGFLDENGQPTKFFNLKLAPNNKIYITVPPFVPSRYLHVIDQPDMPGAACNVLQHAIQLPTYNVYSVPNHPVSRLGVMEGSPCDTLTTAVSEIPLSEQRFATVFPNPAHGQVSIDFGIQPLAPMLWVLNDALGRQLRVVRIASGQESAQMDIQGLPPGFYVYQLKSNGQLLEAGKLVIE